MITRAGLADEIDGIDVQIKVLNEMKSAAYKSYREQLEGAGMEPRRAAAEVAATKAAIVKRRKLRENPDEAREKDDLIDAILVEIMGRPSRAREAQSYADQKGRGDIGAALSAVLGVEVEIVRVDSETGEIIEHASDCAVHNEPAFPAGECDCGASGEIIENQESEPGLGHAPDWSPLAARGADESAALNSDATASEPEATGLAPRATLSHSDAHPLRPASEQPEAPISSPEASGALSNPAQDVPPSPQGEPATGEAAGTASASPSSSYRHEKPDCLEPASCKLGFTSALCWRCNDARMKARASA